MPSVDVTYGKDTTHVTTGNVSDITLHTAGCIGRQMAKKHLDKPLNYDDLSFYDMRDIRFLLKKIGFEVQDITQDLKTQRNEIIELRNKYSNSNYPYYTEDVFKLIEQLPTSPSPDTAKVNIFQKLLNLFRK